MTGILLGPRHSLGAAVEPGTVALPDGVYVEGINRAVWFLGADGFTYWQLLDEAHKHSAWLNPQVGMEQYEVMASLNPGSDPLEVGRDPDVWISAVESPRWGYGGPGGPRGGTITVQVRRVSDLVVVDTAEVEMSVSGSLGGFSGGGTA